MSKKRLTYKQLKAAVRKHPKIMSFKTYEKYYTEIPGAYASPNKIFEDEWKSWPEFTGRKTVKYLTHKQHKAAARKHPKITNGDTYRKHYLEIPGAYANPNIHFKDEWKSWPEFLGNRKYGLKEKLRKIGLNVHQTERILKA